MVFSPMLRSCCDNAWWIFGRSTLLQVADESFFWMLFFGGKGLKRPRKFCFRWSCGQVQDVWICWGLFPEIFNPAVNCFPASCVFGAENKPRIDSVISLVSWIRPWFLDESDGISQKGSTGRPVEHTGKMVQKSGELTSRANGSFFP